MLRSRILLSLSCFLCSSILVGSGCKKGEEGKAAPESKPAEVAPETPPEAAEEPPVKGDLALMDKMLEALGDATVSKGGGLPPVKGQNGISCGDEAVVSAALAHIGFDAAPLKEGVGFRASDVCVGWRPYLQPPTEMYWMISAGSPNAENGLMPHRRCLRVRVAEGANTKDAIIDGPCLELHRKGRAAALAAEEKEKKEAAAKGADDKAAPDKGADDKAAADKGAKDKAAPEKAAPAPSK